MKRLGLITLMIAMVVATSCKNENADKNVDATADEQITDAQMKEKASKKADSKPMGNRIAMGLESKSESTATGKVLFTEEDGVVKFEAYLMGLDPGTHAIHIHEKADCSSADGKSSGGHWNPTHTAHGKWGAAEGYHKGDIGNFVVDESGNGKITMETDEWCIGCGDENKDIVGKAIIVHQGTDDFTSQPSGAAGARVSCGGIIK